jgi:hypothetical protein
MSSQILENTISSIESSLNNILNDFNRKSNRFFAWLTVSRLDIHPDHVAYVFDIIVERRGNEKDYVVISFVYRRHGSVERRAFAHIVSHMFPTHSDTKTILSLAQKLAKVFYTTS